MSLSSSLLFGAAAVYGVVCVDQLIKQNYIMSMIHFGYFISTIGYAFAVD